MPLAAAINRIDQNRVLVGKSKDLRRYRVGGADDFIDYVETTISTEVEYPRLTEAAADDYLAFVEQNAASFRDWKITKVEDSRFVKSFKIVATQTTTSTVEANIAPPPTVGGITWSRNNATVSSWPQSITMTSANSADRIWYRIDAVNSSGATVPGTFTNGGSNNVTVSLNSTTLKAGRDGHHKQVVIVAEVRRTQLTGQTFIGEQSSRTFTQNAPSISAITWNISDNLNVTSWPVSVIATSTTAGASVFNRITAFNAQNNEVVGNFTSGGTFSANTSTLAAGAGGFHKRILIEAEARVTLDGFVYTGARSGRNVRQLVPNINLVFSPQENVFDPSNFGQNMYDFPITVNVAVSVSGTVNLSFRKQDWANGSVVRESQSSTTLSGPGSVNVNFTHGQPPTYYANETQSYWYVRLITEAQYELDGITYTQTASPFYYAKRRLG